MECRHGGRSPHWGPGGIATQDLAVGMAGRDAPNYTSTVPTPPSVGIPTNIHFMIRMSNSTHARCSQLMSMSSPNPLDS